MSRILIVDDEFLIRYTLEEGLRDRDMKPSLRKMWRRGF